MRRLDAYFVKNCFLNLLHWMWNIEILRIWELRKLTLKSENKGFIRAKPDLKEQPEFFLFNCVNAFPSHFLCQVGSDDFTFDASQIENFRKQVVNS